MFRYKKFLKNYSNYFIWIIFIGLGILVVITTYLTFGPNNQKTNLNFNNENKIKENQLKNKNQNYLNNFDFNLKSNVVYNNKDDEENLSDEFDIERLYLVLEVIDGDTFKLEDGQLVRLIGIDTPERGTFYYNEAKNYLKNLIEGKKVLLEKDVSDYDKYNRFLRYVWLPLDDENYLLVNLEMVENGFAYVWIYPPDVRYANELQEAQKEAQEKNKGLWK